MKIILIPLSLICLFASCSETQNSIPSKREEGNHIAQPTEELNLTDRSILENLIQKKLLRVDINFLTRRNSGEFVNDTDHPEPDSSVGCSVIVYNFSETDIVLDETMFWDYLNYDIVELSTNEQVGCLSPSPGKMKSSLIKLEAGEQKGFSFHYSAYSCFMSVWSDDGKSEYREAGVFRLNHEMFPDDTCDFSISKDGIVRQSFDLKIYDDHE